MDAESLMLTGAPSEAQLVSALASAIGPGSYQLANTIGTAVSTHAGHVLQRIATTAPSRWLELAWHIVSRIEAAAPVVWESLTKEIFKYSFKGLGSTLTVQLGLVHIIAIGILVVFLVAAFKWLSPVKVEASHSRTDGTNSIRLAVSTEE